MKEKAKEHRGSCLCGEVRYRLLGELPDFEVCHCRQCQKAQGGACVVVAPVAAENFKLLAGAAFLSAFRASKAKERVFCSRCGSPLFSRRDDRPDTLRLRVGTLDDSRDGRVASHAHLASQVAWFPFDDTGARHLGPRPG